VKLTSSETEVDDVSEYRDKNRCAFLEKPISGDRIRLLVIDRILTISDIEAHEEIRELP